VRITKDVEYALIALAAMAKASGLTTTAELAERFEIPLFRLRKVFQRLQRAGIVTSVQGAGGGYAFARSPETLSIAEVAEAVHGPVRLVPCLTADGVCESGARCTIRRPMRDLQSEWVRFLSSLSLREFIGVRRGRASPALGRKEKR